MVKLSMSNPEESQNGHNPYLQSSSSSRLKFENFLKTDNGRFTLLAIAVIVIVLGIVFANSSNNDQASKGTQSVGESWAPSGFDQYSDDFAIRWKEDLNVQCEGCRYWTLQVIPKNECTDGVQGSLKVTYANNGALFGNVYSEESYLVPARQTVDLVFKVFPKDVYQEFSGQVVYVGCR